MAAMPTFSELYSRFARWRCLPRCMQLPTSLARSPYYDLLVTALRNVLDLLLVRVG